MRGSHDQTGRLLALRRHGAAGLAVFVLIFAIGLLRGEAIALATADETCVFMGGTRPALPLPSDPSDLADRTHDCCDLGLCVAGGLGPSPLAPEPATAPRAVLRLRRRLAPRPAPATAKGHSALPRGPPSRRADAAGPEARHAAARRPEA
jgi:hypothetical protein